MASFHVEMKTNSGEDPLKPVPLQDNSHFDKAFVKHLEARMVRESVHPIIAHFSGLVVILTDSIGDAVLSLPALHAIEEMFSELQVMIVASEYVGDLLQLEFPHWAFISATEVEELKSCDVLVDAFCVSWGAECAERIECAYKVGFDFSDRKADGKWNLVQCGPFTDNTSACELYNPLPRFFNSAIQLKSTPRFNRIMRQHPIKTRVGIIPGAGCFAKRWPMTNFITVEKWLSEHEYEPVWFLGPKECDLYHIAQSRGNLVKSSLEAGALIRELSQCDAAISNDTALMHLSAALGVSTFGIFGPSLPGQWFPYLPPSRHFQHQDAGREKGVITKPDDAYPNWPAADQIILALMDHFSKSPNPQNES